MKRIMCLCLCASLFAGLWCQGSAALAQGGQAKQGKPPAPAAAVELPLDHGGKIESKHDGFRHETVVALRKMSVTCADVKGGRTRGMFRKACVSLAASLHCPGKQLDYVRHATLQLVFEANDWDARHPLGERDLTVVADGETQRLGAMQLVNTGVSDGWLDDKMKETFEVSMPYATFERIARAQHVEMSVGKTAFELRAKNVAALRDLRNRVKVAQR